MYEAQFIVIGISFTISLIVSVLAGFFKLTKRIIAWSIFWTCIAFIIGSMVEAKTSYSSEDFLYWMVFLMLNFMYVVYDLAFLAYWCEDEERKKREEFPRLIESAEKSYKVCPCCGRDEYLRARVTIEPEILDWCRYCNYTEYIMKFKEIDYSYLEGRSKVMAVNIGPFIFHGGEGILKLEGAKCPYCEYEYGEYENGRCTHCGYVEGFKIFEHMFTDVLDREHRAVAVEILGATIHGDFEQLDQRNYWDEEKPFGDMRCRSCHSKRKITEAGKFCEECEKLTPWPWLEETGEVVDQNQERG